MHFEGWGIEWMWVYYRYGQIAVFVCVCDGGGVRSRGYGEDWWQREANE